MKKSDIHPECGVCGSDRTELYTFDLRESTLNNEISGFSGVFCEACGEVRIYGNTHKTEKGKVEVQRVLAIMEYEFNQAA